MSLEFLSPLAGLVALVGLVPLAAFFHMRARARGGREALALGARRFLHKSSTLDEFLAVGSVFKELLDGRGNVLHG